MITRLCGSLLLVALPFVAHGADPATNRLDFPKAGFSIAPLDTQPGIFMQQVLLMSLPVADNFTPNVNVLIQPYKGTLDEYTTLTLKQFKEHNIKLIEQKRVSDSVLALEYTGQLSGREVHWYGRAEKAGERIYLTTATTTEKLWPDQSGKLKECVDSFRCNNAPPAAKTEAAPPK